MPAPLPYDHLPTVPTLSVTSDDMADAKMLDDRYVNSDFGLPGSDVSPHLAWSGHPPQSRGFAVTCHDPDAPTGSGFWHWVLFDIPSDVTELARGAATVGAVSVPPGARHVRNDAGTFGYLGPAPDKGDDPHRYVFAVHALDCASLGVDETVSPAVVGYHLSHHVLARGLLVPVWGHQPARRMPSGVATMGENRSDHHRSSLPRSHGRSTQRTHLRRPIATSGPRSVPHPAVGAPAAPNHLASATSSVC